MREKFLRAIPKPATSDWLILGALITIFLEQQPDAVMQGMGIRMCKNDRIGSIFVTAATQYDRADDQHVAAGHQRHLAQHTPDKK